MLLDASTGAALNLIAGLRSYVFYRYGADYARLEIWPSYLTHSYPYNLI